MDTNKAKARTFVAAMVLALGAGCGGMVAAQGHPMRGMEGPPGAGVMFGGPPERVARHVDHMLDGLGASDAQRTQVKQIAQAAATDLKAQRDAGAPLHDEAASLFTAPTVDANALESLRQRMLAQQDQASRRVMQAMLDISRVLTPDQRAKLAERMKQHNAVARERMQRMQRDQPRG